ncbi:MAG: hypothetical protein QXU12_06140 [Nitrososphaerota archaeon]
MVFLRSSSSPSIFDNNCLGHLDASGDRRALSGIVYTFATLGSFTSTVVTGMLFELFGSSYAQLIFAPLALLIAITSYVMRGVRGRP